jgi:hypothetical protein
MMPVRIALAAAIIILAATGGASAGFFGKGGLILFCDGGYCAV